MHGETEVEMVQRWARQLRTFREYAIRSPNAKDAAYQMEIEIESYVRRLEQDQ